MKKYKSFKLIRDFPKDIAISIVASVGRSEDSSVTSAVLSQLSYYIKRSGKLHYHKLLNHIDLLIPYPTKMVRNETGSKLMRIKEEIKLAFRDLRNQSVDQGSSDECLERIYHLVFIENSQDINDVKRILNQYNLEL